MRRESLLAVNPSRSRWRAMIYGSAKRRAIALARSPWMASSPSIRPRLRDSGPRAIITGPDGNLWFVESVGNAIGRMDLRGTCRRLFPTPSRGQSTGDRPRSKRGIMGYRECPKPRRPDDDGGRDPGRVPASDEAERTASHHRHSRWTGLFFPA